MKENENFSLLFDTASSSSPFQVLHKMLKEAMQWSFPRRETPLCAGGAGGR